MRYLSAGRSGDGEELPANLVDLDRTRKEIAEQAEELAREARLDEDEDREGTLMVWDFGVGGLR